MKRSMLVMLIAVSIMMLIASSISGIDLKKGSKLALENPSLRGEELYVDVELVGGRGRVFKGGENVNISFSTSRDAYVVVYNIDAEGYVHLLFPMDGRPVRCEGLKRYFLPEPGSKTYWETSGKTGIEYIHALAVEDAKFLDEDELYFLSSSEKQSKEKMFRIEDDPFLAFNMIDEEIVRDADRNLKATDYTYFYISKRVAYPRYMCNKCHGESKIADPYAQECPEAIIEEISYSKEPGYPYPELYDIQYASEESIEQERDYSIEERQEEKPRNDGTRIYLFGFYGHHWYPWPFYWGYFGDPFFWDPFWSGFSWSIWWGDPWWPYYYGYGWRYTGWCCWNPCWYCREYPGYLWTPAAYRRIHRERNLVKRTLDYGTTHAQLVRERSLKDSRLVREKQLASAERIQRSDLRRMAIKRESEARTRERSGLDNHYRSPAASRTSRDSRIERGTPRRTERTSYDRTTSRGSPSTPEKQTSKRLEREATSEAQRTRQLRESQQPRIGRRKGEDNENRERRKEDEKSRDSRNNRSTPAGSATRSSSERNTGTGDRAPSQPTGTTRGSSPSPYRGASSATRGSSQRTSGKR